MIYCKNCGKQIDDDSKFCQFCGCEVEVANSKNVEQEHYEKFEEDEKKKPEITITPNNILETNNTTYEAETSKSKINIIVDGKKEIENASGKNILHVIGKIIYYFHAIGYMLISLVLFLYGLIEKPIIITALSIIIFAIWIFPIIKKHIFIKYFKNNFWLYTIVGILVSFFIIIMMALSIGLSQTAEQSAVQTTNKQTANAQPVEQKTNKTVAQEKKAPVISAEKLQVLSKGFGYTQYGEPGVVGKIKNNNNSEVWARVDITIVDKNENLIGDTYTYQKLAPGEIWKFEAPVFGDRNGEIRLKLSVDEP